MRQCPACSSQDRVFLEKFCKGDWKIARCDECNFVYLANPVNYFELEEQYAWEKTSTVLSQEKRKQRSFFRNGLSELAKRASRQLRKPHGSRFLETFGQGKVLDIGCGGGTSLPEPLIPFGIEVSRVLAAKADALMQQRGGYCIQANALAGMAKFDSSMFDGILIHSFLEHEVEPLALMQGAARLLRSGGKIYLRVPNFESLNRIILGAKWPGFRYPDHVNYFTPVSLINMCAKAGLQVEGGRSYRWTFDDNIKIVLVKNGLARSNGSS